MLTERKSDLTYVIYTPSFDSSIGGICALHYLAHSLCMLGAESVYLTASEKNHRWLGVALDEILPGALKKTIWASVYLGLLFLRKILKIPTIKRKINRKINYLYAYLIWDIFDKEKTVVIYPETVKGNPLNAKNVIRWILLDPKIADGYGLYEKDDHVFLYHDFYGKNCNYDVKGILTAIDLNFHLQTFVNFNSSERTGGAYLIKKGRNLNKHPLDFIEADDIFHKMNDSERAVFFNSIKYFVSYDPYTFFSEQAALCGCISVVLLDQDDISKKISPRYGVAYGFDDSEFAASTLDNLRENLEIENDKNMKTIQSFKKYCQRNFIKCSN